MPVESPTQDMLDQEQVAVLRDVLGVGELHVQGTPDSGGWSSSTFFLRGDGSRLVLRMLPTGETLFPEHDIGTQAACMRHVRAHGLPTPEVVLDDPDGAVLGRPMYVMERLSGHVPSDDYPPFTVSGFLVEAEEEQRRAYHLDLVRHIARLHLIPPPDGLGIGPLVTDHLAWCRDLLVRGGNDDRLLGEAHAYMDGAAPPDGAGSVMVWGDARPANTVVDDDFSVVGMLDWELAGTGPAEMDIAWLIEMNRLRARKGAVDPILPGFLTEEETWREWSGRVGREPEAKEWHQVFAAYKVVVFLELNVRAQIRRGELAPGHPLLSDNRARRRLRALLERVR